MKNISYFKKNGIHLLFLFFAIIVAALFVSVSRYALPKTDDFSNLWYGVTYFNQGNSASGAAWKAMVNGYLGQQGTFFSGFTATFLLLKVGTDIVKFRHVVMAFVCFFFASYIFSLRILAKHFRFDAIWGAFLFGTLLTAVDHIGPGESLMFITGIAVYGLPIALSLLSVAFYTLVMDSTKTWQLVLFTIASALCAFPSCGGVLMVAAMTNMLMVLVFIHQWYTSRRFPLRGIIPFLFAFGSALTNALAPGNFVRYQNQAGEAAAKPHLGQALVNSFGISAEQILSILSSTYALILLVVIALLILFSKQELEDHYRIHPLFFFLAAYALYYIVIFPSALGYDMVPHGYIQERTVFTFTQAATVGLFIAWTYLWLWIKAHKHLTLELSKRHLINAFIVLVVCVAANIIYVPMVRGGETNPTVTQIYKEFSSQSIKEYYAARYLGYLVAMNTREDTAFYMTYELPESKLFPDDSLSSDPTWWVNRTMSYIYKVPLYAYTPSHTFGKSDLEQYNTTLRELQP